MKKLDRKGFENKLSKWCHKHGFYWQHGETWEPTEEAESYEVYTHPGKELCYGDQERMMVILGLVA